MTQITTGPDGQPLFDGMTVGELVERQEQLAAGCAAIGLHKQSGEYSMTAAALRHLIAQRPAPAADTDLVAITELIAAAEECASDLACHVNTITTENDRRLYDSERRRHETDMAPVSRLRAAVARVRGEAP